MTENYIEAARAVFEEDNPDPDLEVNETLADLYLLLVLVKGDQVTTEDVHDAWSVWRARTRPGHQAIVPFDELPYATRVRDRPFAEHIAATALVIRARATKESS